MIAGMYEELRSDRHSVVLIAGADLTSILVKAGPSTPEAVNKWLAAEFPKSRTSCSVLGSRGEESFDPADQFTEDASRPPRSHLASVLGSTPTSQRQSLAIPSRGFGKLRFQQEYWFGLPG